MMKKLLFAPITFGLVVASVQAESPEGKAENSEGKAANPEGKAANPEGKAAYATCIACHNDDGQGRPVGAKKMAPSLVGSKVVTGDPSVLALAVLKGIKKEGTEYMMVMAPLETALADDKKLAAVLTYVRQSFGNNASAVTVEDAAKFRAKWKEQKEPITRAKLQELSK